MKLFRLDSLLLPGKKPEIPFDSVQIRKDFIKMLELIGIDDKTRRERGILKTELIKKYGKEKYDEIKYHIILGDAGFLWPGNVVEEIRILNTLKELSFPVLCVLGNHDPVLGRNDLQEIDIGIGEKVIVIKIGTNRKKNHF